jgi:hypothetical protein
VARYGGSPNLTQSVKGPVQAVRCAGVVSSAECGVGRLEGQQGQESLEDWRMGNSNLSSTLRAL